MRGARRLVGLLASAVLAACAAPVESPAVPFTPGCQVARGVEWTPSGEPFATSDLAMEHLGEQAQLRDLPTSGWRMVSDDGAGTRIYASGSWGIEVHNGGQGWRAVSASTCH